jgi:hypothetical protein
MHVAFGLCESPSPFTASRSSVSAEGILHTTTTPKDSSIAKSPSDTSTNRETCTAYRHTHRQIVGLHLDFGDNSISGCGRQQHVVEIGQSKVGAYDLWQRALTFSPVALAENPHGEPTWRESARKSTLSTWTSCMNRTGFV